VSKINKIMLATAAVLFLLISLVSAFHPSKEDIAEKSAAAQASLQEAQRPQRIAARDKLLLEASDPDFGFKTCRVIWNAAQKALTHVDTSRPESPAMKKWAGLQVDADDCQKDLDSIREESRQVDRVDATGYALHDLDAATTLDQQKNNLAALVAAFNAKWVGRKP
jgi:hypothetical protein